MAIRIFLISVNGPLMIRTGHTAWVRTRCETLPRKSSSTCPLPRAPIRMRSACSSWATDKMSSAGEPSSNRVSRDFPLSGRRAMVRVNTCSPSLRSASPATFERSKAISGPIIENVNRGRSTTCRMVRVLTEVKPMTAFVAWKDCSDPSVARSTRIGHFSSFIFSW